MALFALPATQAGAVGCLTGGVIGGVAGHYAGHHHGVVGALGGCIAGHELHKKQVAARKMKRHQEVQPAPPLQTKPQQP